MHKLGKKQLTLQLPQQLNSLPLSPSLPSHNLALKSETAMSSSTPTIAKDERTGITEPVAET